MPILKSATEEIEYIVDGSGPNLILVHGTGGNAETNWGHLVPQLAEKFRVIRPNYSGSGATQDDGGMLSLEKLAKQIIAVADATESPTFDLVGFSLGAAVAAYVAAHYPARVRRLILLAGFASSADSRLSLQFGLWRNLIDHDRRAAAELIMLTGFSPAWVSAQRLDDLHAIAEDIVTGNRWDGMRRQVELDLDLDVRACAGKIACPTLAIGCAHDHMVAPAHSRALARLIANAEYAELPSGHLAPLETPEAFLNLVQGFLSR
jgi:3-oxoadipate enol-lactonase